MEREPAATGEHLPPDWALQVPGDGATAKAAAKGAVLVEDVARTVHIACQLGQPLSIESTAVDALHDRYQNVHGQTLSSPVHHHDLERPWFGGHGGVSTQSGTLQRVQSRTPTRGPQ